MKQNFDTIRIAGMQDPRLVAHCTNPVWAEIGTEEQRQRDIKTEQLISSALQDSCTHMAADSNSETGLSLDSRLAGLIPPSRQAIMAMHAVYYATQSDVLA